MSLDDKLPDGVVAGMVRLPDMVCDIKQVMSGATYIIEGDVTATAKSIEKACAGQSLAITGTVTLTPGEVNELEVKHLRGRMRYQVRTT